MTDKSKQKVSVYQESTNTIRGVWGEPGFELFCSNCNNLEEYTNGKKGHS